MDMVNQLYVKWIFMDMVNPAMENFIPNFRPAFLGVVL